MTRHGNSSNKTRRADPGASLKHDLNRYARHERNNASFWRSLSVIGVGWMIVIAAVGGALAGRWLHAQWNTGIWLTALLVVAGASIGMALVWQLIRPRRR
jgi:ATP synthase protein I